MSSAPAGVDVREYAYGYYYFVVPDANVHTFSGGNRWLVTKIQIFAGAADADLVLEAGGGGTGGPPDIGIAAGGCLTLEPNGAFRGRIDLNGQGTAILIEFWWQPTGNVTYPTVTVT